MMYPQLNEEQVEWLWSSRSGEKEEWSKARGELRQHISEAESDLGHWLLGRAPLASVTVEQVRALEAGLSTHLLRNALREITTRVQQNVPQCPLARVALRVERQPNPINPVDYSPDQVRRSHAVITGLQRGLRLPEDEIYPTRLNFGLDTRARIGLLLLSAAYGGGLLDMEQLNALIKVKPQDINHMAGVPEVRLTLPVTETKSEYRQWFPDPATMALLTANLEEIQDWAVDSHHKGALIYCVNRLLDYVDVTKADQPRSLNDMLGLIRLELNFNLPQLQIQYASRGVVSHSLRPTSWGSIFGRFDQIDPKGTYDDPQKGRKVKEDVPEWVQTLCTEVRSGSVSPLQGPDDQDSLISLVRAWAAYMVNGSSAYGEAQGRASIANYVRLVGFGLASQLDSFEVFELEYDALEAIYEGILEIQPTDSRRQKTARGLYEFHHYLHRNHGLPPISAYSQLGISKGLTRVDARILSEEQYQQVLQSLTTSKLAFRSPRLVTAVQVFIILGFRLGLRRNEALKLRLQDLHVSLLPEQIAERVRRRHKRKRQLSGLEISDLQLDVDLLVRPHAQRGLKTRKATRRLPVHILLSPEELEILKAWYRERMEEEKRQKFSEYLFCIPEFRTQWISEEAILPAIHQAMRAVTGNEEVSYHHLRHSCATWLLLKTMRQVYGTPVDMFFDDLEQTRAWLCGNPGQPRLELAAAGSPTRKILHHVSEVLGHVSPKTTLLHYIHSMPMLAAASWQWNPEAWRFTAHNVAILGRVTVPKKTGRLADATAQRDYMLNIIGRVPLLRQLRKEHRRIKRKNAQAQVRPDGNWAIQRIMRIEALLSYVSYAEATGRSVNLDGFEFSAADREQMIERARHIRDLGEKGSRHRVSKSPHADGQYRQLMPSPPKTGGRELLADHAQRLYELLESEEGERANRVIDFFIERVWSTDTTLRFYRDQDEVYAQDYLWLLQSIGFQRSQIELITYDQDTPVRTQRYWRKVLGIKASFLQQAPESKSVTNHRLGIRVTLHTEEGDAAYHSGSGLRYLLLAASIDWHFRI